MAVEYSAQVTPQTYQPAERKTREEVGGILERAFEREDGHEPDEAEAQRLLTLAREAEGRAEAAESLAEEYERETAGRVECLREQLSEEAEAYRREAEQMHQEAERLRSRLP